MAVSIVIAQPFNVMPAKGSMMNFFRPFSRASKDKTVESTCGRAFMIISKR